MRVVAIDQSLKSSAAVIFDVFGNQLDISDQFIHSPKSTGIYRLVEHHNWIIDLPKCELLVRERHNMRQFGAAASIHQLTALIDIKAHQRELLDGGYAAISPGTWKKFITGKGAMKKDTSYLLKLNDFIPKHPLLNVPSDFRVTNDDIADAICLGITGYAAWRMMNGQSVPVSKESLEHLKKNIKGMFDHGKRSDILDPS